MREYCVMESQYDIYIFKRIYRYRNRLISSSRSNEFSLLKGLIDAKVWVFLVRCPSNFHHIKYVPRLFAIHFQVQLKIQIQEYS